MERVGKHETQRTQRRISRRYRQNYDAQNRNHAADVAEHVLGDNADEECGNFDGIHFGRQSQMYRAHSRRRPAHCDKTFRNHRVVVNKSPVLFARDGAGNQRRLRRVKAARYAASNRNKEHRDKVFAQRMNVNNSRLPNFQQRVIVNEQPQENSERAEQKYRAENRIYAPDNLINRQERRN